MTDNAGVTDWEFSIRYMRNRFLKMLLLAAAVLNISVLCCGQEILANGHKLFLKCNGSAPGPTVILVAGAGGTTDTWKRVQPQIADFAKVCSYDRTGLGRSEKLSYTQSADQIVDDLAILLQVARVNPPYILVGHSIGGIYVRKYDQRYDSYISGMLLIDSSHKEQIWRFAMGDPQVLADEFPNWRNTTAMQAIGYLPPEHRLQWHFSKPLIVLEHGIPSEPVWHQMQQDLARRSPQGKLITAKQSRHYIQEQQPELVIESVLEIRSQAVKNFSISKLRKAPE